MLNTGELIELRVNMPQFPLFTDSNNNQNTYGVFFFEGRMWISRVNES